MSSCFFRNILKVAKSTMQIFQLHRSNHKIDFFNTVKHTYIQYWLLLKKLEEFCLEGLQAFMLKFNWLGFFPFNYDLIKVIHFVLGKVLYSIVS